MLETLTSANKALRCDVAARTFHHLTHAAELDDLAVGPEPAALAGSRAAHRGGPGAASSALPTSTRWQWRTRCTGISGP